MALEAKQPNMPTAEEVAQHELTHLPAMPWCAECIKGRGKDAPHHDRQNHSIDAPRPTIELDYGYLTEQGAEGVGSEPAQPGLYAVDRASTATFATAVTTKGPQCAYAVAAFASWIRELGHARVIVQTDGEPALVAFANAARDRIIADGIVDQLSTQVSPVGSHQSNGGAERSV